MIYCLHKINYRAEVPGLFDRKVIGRALSGGMESGRTVIPALEMAAGNRTASPGLLFHFNRDVQYCSKSFRELLRLRYPPGPPEHES